MRFRGWLVEGFGLLRDFRIDDIPDGLTVVSGPNEAGKTSLLAFIRGVLFGYPDRRKRERQYPPLRGGRHGGRLFLDSEGSTWTVERFASPSNLVITQPDGTLGSEADLRRLLGGVDAELYRNVFAFSLSELQEFDTLQVEGVRDRIFAAGVVGAGRSARAAIQLLASARAELGRKRGDCRINDLRRKIAELDVELEQAQSRAVGHAELRRATESADVEEKGIGRELAGARRDLARLEVLIAAWPDWDERVQAESELAALAGAPDLPDDLATRLDTALIAVQSHLERRDERRVTAVDLEHQVAECVLDERLAAVAKDVKRLAAQSGAIKGRRDKLNDLRHERDVLRKRVSEEASRLGPGWTMETVGAFDTSIPAAQEVSDWGESLHTADQAVADAERRAENALVKVQELTADVALRAAALEHAPSVPAAEDLVSQEGAVRQLRTRLLELSTLRGDVRAIVQRIADADRRASEANGTTAAAEAELERRSNALLVASVLPTAEALSAQVRSLRDLRTRVSDLELLQSEYRLAEQKVHGAEERAESAAESLGAKAAQAEARLEALREMPPLPEVEHLADQQRVARELRRRVSALGAIRDEAHTTEARIAERRGDAARQPAPATMAIPRRALIATAVASCGMALALALWSQPVGAGSALLVGIAIALLARWLPSRPTASPGHVSARLADDVLLLQRLRARLEEEERQARPLAEALGCSGLPDLQELDAKADEIAEQVQARWRCDHEMAAIRQLEREVSADQEVVQRLRGAATDTRRQTESAYRERLVVLEGAALTVAKTLGFEQVPSAAAIEDKSSEIGDLVRRRSDHDRETTALEILRAEVGRHRANAENAVRGVATLQRELKEFHEVNVQAAEQSALLLAQTLGLEEIPDTASLEARAEQISVASRARAERDREIAALVQLRQKEAQAVGAADQAQDVVGMLRGERDTTNGAWLKWKRERQCPEALRPETARQFFVTVERLRESLTTLDGFTSQIAAIGEEIGAFTNAVATAYENAGVEQPPASVLAEDAVGLLRERVDSQTQLQDKRTQLTLELEGAGKALAGAESNLNLAKANLTAVFNEADADDESTCRTRIHLSLERAEVRKRLHGAEQRLRSRLGMGEPADALRAELALGSKQDWEARGRECKEALVRLQPAHEEAVRRHQSALEALTTLEKECDVVALATAREGLVAEVREALGDWRRLAIAQALIQATLRRYELERQPAVLTRAAESFSRVTQGRYAKLVVREEGIDVLAADGGRIDSSALSRGAAEQLYLCLRLALASEFGRLSVPLPLVMDDVLVNFDPERARLAAEVLLEATKRHQVLLFTCHPETVELLVNLSTDVNVIEIPRQLPSERLLEEDERTSAAGRDGMEYGGAIFPLPPEDAECAERVLAAIRAAGRPLSRAELLAATELPEARWTPVIQALRDRGRVVSHGRKRGATWGVVESGDDSDGR